MSVTCEPRYRKRVPCQLVTGQGSHPGMVLNVSRGGLFVQTSARARPGDRVRLALNASAESGAIGLEARVVWKRVSPPQLQSFTQGGVGLEIQLASEAY
jgi:Tfp pilus assembly protein PilZ